MKMKGILITIFAEIFLAYFCAGDTSTFPSVNRGAARQMFGSGNLRQTGGDSILIGTTQPPINHDDKQSKNDVNNDDKHSNKPSGHYEGHLETHGNHGYNRGHQSKTHSRIPPDYYPSGFKPPIPDFDLEEYDESFDGPSYRNGAVNGVRMPNGGGYHWKHNQGRGGLDRPKNGLYGSYEPGSYGEFADRSRVHHHGLSRGHGVNNMGDANPNRFGSDRKAKVNLIHEVDDDNDMFASCGHNCNADEFLCISTCTCIDANFRCDTSINCENSEDELECDDFLEAKKLNETCSDDKKIICPETHLCILKQWLCDGDDDCGDFSDETLCGVNRNCTEDQFECRNKLCIPQAWFCDGENDCRDFSDEENCTGKIQCREDEFTCSSGSCILKKYVCDGEEDCDDGGSDESNCQGIPEVVCDENHFECQVPKCIRKEFRCDGTDDCGDASDEEDCFGYCNNQFKCDNGTCIRRTMVCDGVKDCQWGEDEATCKTVILKSCAPDEFSCESDGFCIPKSWVCDSSPDCPNAVDEKGCPVSCAPNEFMCTPPDKTSDYWLTHHPNHYIHPLCIPRKHVCDGEPNCPSKDDEMNCPKKRDCSPTDKCAQLCISTYKNEKTCACEQGFTLASDNFTCNDINECEFHREPVCSQLCNNTIGSFVCGCITGYVLRPDLRTCKAVGGYPSLLFTNRVDIRKISLEPSINSKYTPVLKGLHNAIAMDYHYDEGYIYWSDVSLDVIRRVDINGSNPEDVIRWGLESPSGVAIDWIHNLLFWTDAGTQRVEVLTLKTRIRHVLISNDLDKPRAIAVHPYYGFVFWTDWGPSAKIERADMDGSNRIALVTESITWPNGLTIDYPAERIFWTEAKHRVIMSAKLDGSDKKKIISKGIHHPFAITVFEDSIYWTDWHFKSISSTNKETGDHIKIIRSDLHFPMDLHSFHKQRQPSYPNHCGNNNGKCSHMCLPNSAGYTCVCPVNLKLKNDGKNCAEDNFLLLARHKDLRLIPVDKSTVAFDTVIPVDHVQSAVALAWDYQENMIYWTDVELDTISRAHLNGSNQIIVINNNLESPAGLALDWVTKKLYWTDAGTNKIECSNLNGTMRTLLINEGLDKPRDIVVDVTSGFMYWSDWGDKPKIEEASMDGSQRKILINDKLIWPNGLAIDLPTGSSPKKLYWADGGRKSIEYIVLDGKGKRVKVHADLPHPFGLVIYQDKVYWTDWDTKSIHRADKDTGNNTMVVRSDLSGLMDVRMYHRIRLSLPNPCEKDNGQCSHLCLLTPRRYNPQGYSCACPTGLVMQENSNGKQCRKIPNKFIIFAHRIDLRFISFDTDYRVDVVLPINNLKNATSVDVDRKTGDIYFTDPGSDIISRATFDGKHVDPIINSGIDTVDSLVVDSIGRKIYWTDAGLNSIEVSELDGSNRKVLIWSGLDNPRAIVLHYAKGIMFWTDWGQNARIERANMDGTERSAIVTDDLVWPNGISIDTEYDKLYWNDAKRKVIEMSDLNGLNRKIFAKNIQHPYGLGIMGNNIYWSDWMTKSIHELDKIKGGDSKLLIEKLNGIMDIKVITSKDNDGLEDVCSNNNGGCSHLCLRNPKNYTCACPTGIILNNDKKTCNSTPNNYLLLVEQNDINLISLDTPERWDIKLKIKNINHPHSIDYHWKKNLIYYSDHIKKDNINRCFIKSINMNNLSDINTIIYEDIDSYYQIAIDWLADNLYWINQKYNTILVSKLNGTNKKLLIDDHKHIKYAFLSHITLFPKYGYMFFVQWSSNSNIQRALLDGTQRKIIISTNSIYPNGLTIDYDNKKLLWTDSETNKIEMSDLNGNYRIQLVASADYPYGLTQHSNYIYWIATPTNSKLKRIDKTGNNKIDLRTFNHVLVNVKAVSKDLQKGWSPCSIDNGGCTHLCLFTKKNYTCACPDENPINCSTVPRKQIPLRKPGTENDSDYDDHEEEEKIPEIVTRINQKDNDKFKNSKSNKNQGYTATMTITIVIISTITIVIIIAIIYLVCQRKPKQEKYIYSSRRNVLTFSNPNYNASGADGGPSSTTQSEKKFIWKRLKYDSSQERVYEDNGQTSSPEVVSLIPPSATPSSSRAPSITPKESSPSLIHITHLNG